MPQTYIIAQNPTVLAQLMRENESRSLNASAYTAPASVFNTIAVDIDAAKTETLVADSPMLPLKTVMLPASELLKLNPIVDESLATSSTVDSSGSELLSNIPQKPLDLKSSPVNQMISPNVAQSLGNMSNIQAFQMPCEIMGGTQPQSIHSLDPIYKSLQASNTSIDKQQHSPLLTPLQHQQFQQNLAAGNVAGAVTVTTAYAPTGATFFQQNACQNVVYSANLPPSSDPSQKSRSLERNTPLAAMYVSRMSSLERMQNANHLKQLRSNSLTRQISAGNDNQAASTAVATNVDYASNARSGSLERSTRLGIGTYGCRTNSLERHNQMLQQQSELVAIDVHRGGSLERNQSVASAYNALKNRGYRGGSLERNHQNMAIVNRSISLERNAQYQEQLKAKDPEPFQEEIYDFGGANVKSCASIALSKSIMKGMVPIGTTLQPNTNASPPPPPLSAQPLSFSMQTAKMPNLSLKSPNLPPPPPFIGDVMSQSFQADSMHFPLPPPEVLAQTQSPPIDTASYVSRPPMQMGHMAQPGMSQLPATGQSALNQAPMMTQQAFTVPVSHYTPMYPLMWLNQPAPFQTTAQKIAHPQLTQIPMAMNVNSVCKNSLLQDVQSSIHSDNTAGEVDGFAPQVRSTHIP